MTTRHQPLVQFDDPEQPGLSAFPDFGDCMLLCVQHTINKHIASWAELIIT